MKNNKYPYFNLLNRIFEVPSKEIKNLSIDFSSQDDILNVVIKDKITEKPIFEYTKQEEEHLENIYEEMESAAYSIIVQFFSLGLIHLKNKQA